MRAALNDSEKWGQSGVPIYPFTHLRPWYKCKKRQMSPMSRPPDRLLLKQSAWGAESSLNQPVEERCFAAHAVRHHAIGHDPHGECMDRRWVHCQPVYKL